jgi:hypothetical protein
METMGFSREKVKESLAMHRYDDSFATYHLLGLKPPSVSDGEIIEQLPQWRWLFELFLT